MRGLNRTFMELKQNTGRILFIWQMGLNRTFMELKRGKVYASGGEFTGLNRTFMELKPGDAQGTHQQLQVLIAPLWN